MMLGREARPLSLRRMYADCAHERKPRVVAVDLAADGALVALSSRNKDLAAMHVGCDE